jgi:AraC-like DNA-binding protein
MNTFLTSLTSLLQQVAAPAGLDVNALVEAGDARLAAQRPARLPSELADQILLLAAERMDDMIGLRAGDTWRPIDFGALGFAWLASYTLRSAFQRTARYARVLGDRTRFAVDDTAEGVKLSAECSSGNRVVAAILIDIAFSTLLSMCRQHGASDFRPVRVLLRRPEPADASPYRDLYLCPVMFGADEDALIISAAAADERRIIHHSELANTFDAMLIAQLAELDRNDLVARCKSEILDTLADGAPEAKHIAEQLHVSQRTLQRKLAERDTSFQGLVDETRRELALRLLDNPSHSVTEVTFLTGFSTPSAFARAFSRWTGLSPTDWRQRRTPRPVRPAASAQFR